MNRDFKVKTDQCTLSMNNMMNGMETKVNALRDTIDGKIYTLDERQLRLTKQGNKLKDNISNLRVSIDYVDSDL